MNNELADEYILKEEIQQMHTLIHNKEKIIQQAAITLETSGKYSDDISIICSKLKKIWRKDISNSLINNSLDEKYKRPYEKQEPETPAGFLEEILFRWQDQNKQMDKIITSIIKKVKSDPNTKKIVELALTDAIHDLHQNPNDYLHIQQFSKIGDLKSLLKFIKSEQTNLDYLEKMTDWRQKLDDFTKIRLKMSFFSEHLAKVGKDIHYSAKWMSAVNRDNTVSDKEKAFKATQMIVQNYRNCPACNWDMAEWFNKANIAERQGEEIKMPKKRINKLS